MSVIIETERLILRTWKEEDVEPYFLINQDPKVLECLIGPLTIEQIRDFIARMNTQQDERNYTLWAAELKTSKQMIGFIGLNYNARESNFTPAVEVGWRLGSQYWGHGYAPEGARACLDYGFNKIGPEEIVSFTVPSNTKSLRVMEKIGLKRDFKNDFAHPNLPHDHRLSQHVLYLLTKNDYIKSLTLKT